MNKDYSNERTPTPSERVVETTVHHLRASFQEGQKAQQIVGYS